MSCPLAHPDDRPESSRERATREGATWGLLDGMPSLDTGGRPLSIFEDAPATLFYTPVALYWAWLALKYRSIGLPTLANPSISAGGLCGESKSAVLNLLGSEGRAVLAPFVTVESRELAAAEAAIAAAGMAYPIVAKPDVGRRGNGVQALANPEQLAAYLARFPTGQRVILQRLIPEEGEAGVFYVRGPDERRGRIVSLTLKYFPRVVGDGRSTLQELILADPRAGRVPHLYLERHARKLASVVEAGKVIRLVEVGNHCKGAIFRNGQEFVTPEMQACFGAICDQMPDFYFGRFDVRFGSIGELQQGRGFTIIEVNGAGSEATHIWDRNTRLRDAYKGLFLQIRLAFEIGAVNRRRGLKPMSGLALLGRYLSERRLMATYPVLEFDPA
jgi:hypothetical protein